MTTFIQVTPDETTTAVDTEQSVITVTPTEIDVPVEDANVVIVVDDLLIDATAEQVLINVGVPDQDITVQVDSVAGPAGADGAPGVVQSIVPGAHVSVDASDPAHPIVSSTGGGSGGIAPVVFDQASPSTFWHIVHGQGYNPSVVVYRTDGTTIAAFGSVYSSDANTVDLYFGAPITGLATLNF